VDLKSDQHSPPPGAGLRQEGGGLVSEYRVQLSQNGTVEHLPPGKCLGLDGKIRPNRRFDTTHRDRKIVLLRSSGKSLRAVAAEIGCSVGTVHRVLGQWQVAG
jgi:DNA-binding NarL/FixJ family response regulator